MTISYASVGGLLGAAIAAIISSSFGFPSRIVIYLVLVGAITGLIAWMYSPLPDSTGGIAGTDPLRGRYWGIHPGKRWKPPSHVSAHETDAKAIYYYGDEYLAIDIENGVKAWGESPDEANQKLKTLTARSSD